ncbi:MAG: hypothetical protein ACI9O6_002422 [Glaciecola sp.]|jgi:hypothetical protein
MLVQKQRLKSMQHQRIGPPKKGANESCKNRDFSVIYYLICLYLIVIRSKLYELELKISRS